MVMENKYGQMDQFVGRANLYMLIGDVYTRDWRDNKANGTGVYIHVNGARYEGTWIDDK
jgi:hypothetical protein